MRAISRGVGLKPFASYRLADNRLVQCYHHDMAGVFNRGIVFPTLPVTKTSVFHSTVLFWSQKATDITVGVPKRT